jgi:hypothetical protein
MAIARKGVGILALVLIAPVPALCQPLAAGRIKIASGAAFVVRQNAMMAAQAGMAVFEADGLKTGPDGHLGVTLRDDTRVSLGPSSEVHLDQFQYSPADGRLGFALRIVSGVVAYASGRIAKLARDAVRLQTPNAIVGIRGTHLAIRVDAP